MDYLLKKSGKHLGVVARLRHFVSKNVLFNYYNFYVKPVLQYGLLIYGGNSFPNFDKLSVCQRKMIRYILFKKRNASIKTDMIKHNVLSLTQLYFYDLIKFALRSVRKELSSEFLNNLYTRANSRATQMQSACKYLIPKDNWDNFSLKTRGTKLLNFLIDQKLVSDNLWDLSQYEFNCEIHKFKDF